MAQAKTKPAQLSARDFLKKVPAKKRREDSEAVLKLMKEVTGAEPEMWGPSIVGFGPTATNTTVAGKGSGC